MEYKPDRIDKTNSQQSLRRIEMLFALDEI